MKTGSNHPGSSPAAAPRAMTIRGATFFPSPSLRVLVAPSCPSPWRRSGGIGTEELGAAEKWRKKEEKACTVQMPRPHHLIKGHFRGTDTWDKAILSNPAIVARNVRGEKGSMEIEASLLIRTACFGTLRPACFLEISYPVKSGIHCNQSRQRFRTPRQQSADDATSLVGNFLNGSRRLSRR